MNAENTLSILSTIESAENTGTWFHFNQNNSGGYFTGPAMSVIVRAQDEAEAWARLKGQPDYNDHYCDCCGPRWFYPMEMTTAEAVKCALESANPDSLVRQMDRDTLPLLVLP